MTKRASLTLDELDGTILGALAGRWSHANVTGDATVANFLTTVVTANTDRAITLPRAKASSGYGDGATLIIVKTDAGGSGKVVLTPDSGGSVGGLAADTTWSSPASAVNWIVLKSDGLGGWTIVTSSGTWS